MMRCTRTQHRSASRQVSDHGRVSGTHRLLSDGRAGSARDPRASVQGGRGGVGGPRRLTATIVTHVYNSLVNGPRSVCRRLVSVLIRDLD